MGVPHVLVDTHTTRITEEAVFRFRTEKGQEKRAIQRLQSAHLHNVGWLSQLGGATNFLVPNARRHVPAHRQVHEVPGPRRWVVYYNTSGQDCGRALCGWMKTLRRGCWVLRVYSGRPMGAKQK